MQRRQFLKGLPSLAIAGSIFTVRTSAIACSHPTSLIDHLQQLHQQLTRVAPRGNNPQPATEALALVAETTARLNSRLPVPPSLWQNLADAITRTQICTGLVVSPDLAPMIAQEIRQLTS